MKKNSTVASGGKQIFKGKKLTIGMDLGDRFSYYCVLGETGEVLIEQKAATSKQAIQQVLRVRIEGWRQRRIGSMRKKHW